MGSILSSFEAVQIDTAHLHVAHRNELL